MRRIMCAVVSTALLALGAACAQNMVYGEEYDLTSVRPLGQVDAGYEPYRNEQDAGAIMLSHATPGDQHANFDVVGPNGYWQHFDFSDAEGDTRRLEDLLPGTYSVAASDEGLGLAHTLVEVRAGEATTVHVELEPWQGDIGAEYDAADTYGSYEGVGEDVQPGYPYGAYAVGAYETYEESDLGALSVEGTPADTQLVVTGPDAYSTSLEGDGELADLRPGRYVLAATGDGYEVSVTTIRIPAGRTVPVDPDFVDWSRP